MRKDLVFVEKHIINKELLKNRLLELHVLDRSTLFQTGVQALQHVEKILTEEVRKTQTELTLRPIKLIMIEVPSDNRALVDCLDKY